MGGLDNNDPANKKKQPTTKGQQRFRKLSSCWMQAVWTANAVVSLDDTTFKQCKTIQIKAFKTVTV